MTNKKYWFMDSIYRISLGTGISIVMFAGSVNAASITSMTLMDIYDAGTVTTPWGATSGSAGSDGIVAATGFNTGVVDRFTGNSGADLLWDGANQGIGEFVADTIISSTGYDINPTTDLSTYGLSSGGLVGDVSANGLTVSNFDFGAEFSYSSYVYHFNLSPDLNTFQVNYFNEIGNGDYEVVFQWSHIITEEEDPTWNFVGFTSHWMLEGVVHTSPVPVPAAFWLFGTGLIGLASFTKCKEKRGRI